MNKLQQAIGYWTEEGPGHRLLTPSEKKMISKLIAAAGDTLTLLNLLADIRAAVGDPKGKLMQYELVQHCRELAEKAERLEQAAGDALMHLETNYDIDGNRMADSDAAEALRNGLQRKDNQ